jgi:uncharacterized protein
MTGSAKQSIAPQGKYGLLRRVAPHKRLAFVAGNDGGGGPAELFEKDTAVPGEIDLAKLLRNMKPEMHDGVFVFCSIPADKEIPAELRPVHLFREREGTTLVLRREEADSAGLSHQFASRLITLTVHSSLEAVGFLAEITGRLAQAGISVNAVSAYYHDHLFVPDHRADEALDILQAMSRPDSAG